MIISKKRELREVLSNIKEYKNIFLIGCSECASLCSTGGEKEIEQLSIVLKKEGKNVTGSMVARTGCQVLGTKKELKPYKKEIDRSDCILVMSCGAGTQAIVELFQDKAVYPANDTLFLGNMTRFQMFDERCSLCGDCILDKTGGICPVTTCPKGLLNGPCGGMTDGKCEVNSGHPCAWVKIYERLKAIDRLDDFCKEIHEPKDWSTSLRPRVLYLRNE